MLLAKLIFLGGLGRTLALGTVTKNFLIHGDLVVEQGVNGIGRIKIGSPEVLIDTGDIMTITGRKRVRRPLKTTSNVRAGFRDGKN